MTGNYFHDRRVLSTPRRLHREKEIRAVTATAPLLGFDIQ